ncbi:hypothetical protein [Deinococcus arenicola]|uniref:Holliday junction resolvase n=1 Tax=Deinococcus arenicola TaxID=2994950 RepID=A0ABU4DXN5_9DEIO|nr:hypothetical protein [Deinococcus sp. ZS9-10]MDV6376444.1 hypothetical protein [Deinococcus sp. ZS9-10]
MTNSRAKGKRGELEFAKALTALGHPATRGVQFRGGEESPDVRCPSLPGAHWEVKFYATCQMFSPAMLTTWRTQAEADAGAGLPLIAHRWNGSRAWWVAVCRPGKPLIWMTLPDLLSTLKEYL